MAARRTRNPTQVALVDMGERTGIDLEYLACKLNSLQSSFAFSIIAPVTLAKIGEPTLEDDFITWYEFKPLFDLLLQHDSIAKYRYVIGVTHLPLTEKATENGKDRGVYFSLSDQEKVAVVSTSERATIYNSPSKSIYQYSAYCIVGELLIMLCKHDLTHTMNNFCLFDDCVDRYNLCGCIEHGKICERCRSRLKEDSISEAVITDVLKVLKWCRTNSVVKSLKDTALHPLSTLFFGLGFGWFGPLINPNYRSTISYLVICCVILVTLGIFIHEQYKSPRSLQQGDRVR